MNELLSPEYRAFLDSLKSRIQAARIQAALAANREIIVLYWSVGRDILAQQASLGWGAKVIDRLSQDLRREFPEIKGFSARNLKYMRALAEAWPDEAIVQQTVAQLPWGHIARILHIERRLHERQGKTVNNFDKTLPRSRSDLIAQTLKDPYVFDFLNLTDEAHERDIEEAMVRHVRETLLEMGVGFAFVGNQVRFQVGDEEFFIDLLFYHLRLHCYVVVELKAGAFRPEHAGKLNFYLSAVDDIIRDPKVDGPTLGLLLCRSKNRLMAEYALRDINKPIGVAEVQLTRLLPESLTSSLPTVEALEAELGDLPESSPTVEED